MTYDVKTISNIEELKSCLTFPIDQYQWIEGYRPEAFGQMALLEDYGIVISMTTMESSPLTRYKENDDPVYKDSAVEAFLNFAPDNMDIGYINFEMNSNGALLSGFGVRPNRKPVKDITSCHATCVATVDEKSWNILLKVPMELICELYSRKPIEKGDSFTCNFYKISEDPSIEHYASFAPIDSPKPNFHLPQFFAKAVIV